MAVPLLRWHMGGVVILLSAVALFLLFFTATGKTEVTAVPVFPNTEKILLGSYGQYLEGVPEQIEIDDVSSLPFSGEFLPNQKDSINFGLTDSTSWFRFILVSKGVQDLQGGSPSTGRTEWCLRLGKQLDYYDDIQFYWRQRGPDPGTATSPWGAEKYGLYQTQLQGVRAPACIDIVLPEIQDSMVEVYLRAKTVSGFFLKPVLYSPEAYRLVSNKLNMYYGMYYGLAFSMIVYNLFTYFFLRDKVRIIFILYAITLSTYFLVANELSGTIFPPQYLEATRKGAQFLILFTFILCISFTIVFLEVRKTMPIFYRVLLILGGLSVAGILLLPFFTYYEIITVIDDFSALVIGVVFSAGVLALYRGYRPAKYFLFSWVFLLGGGLIYVLNFKGIFPYPHLGDNAAQIGSGFEMVFLSLAIADRVKFLFEGMNAAQVKREEQLEKLTHQLVMTEERERRRIAGRLHDSIGQSLCATKLEVQRLLHHRDEKPKQDSNWVSYIDFCIQETRSLTTELYPQVLYQFGLVAALESLAQDWKGKFGLVIDVILSEEQIEIAEELKLLLYRVVFELLHNVVKHANANKAEVELFRSESSIFIIVRDDGTGFEYIPEDNVDKTCFGLFSIQERLHRIGGSLKVQNRQHGGSEVITEVPARITGT